MNIEQLPRTGDAVIFVVTDDSGEKHRVHTWPPSSDAPEYTAAKAKALEYVSKKLAKAH